MNAPKRDNDSKFTIGKYHINTTKIAKLFRVNIFMPVTKLFCRFVARESSYFAKRGHFGSLVSSGGISKKPTVKIGDFALRKKGREKKNEWLR